MWKVNKARGPWQTEGESERRDPKTGGRRPIVLVVEPRCLVFRAKGTRATFRITHERAYELAVMQYADANRKRRPTIKRGVH